MYSLFRVDIAITKGCSKKQKESSTDRRRNVSMRSKTSSRFYIIGLFVDRNKDVERANSSISSYLSSTTMQWFLF